MKRYAGREGAPRWRSRSRLRICDRTETSSAETGSSSTTSRGSVARARAIATRCLCPPESSRGAARGPRPEAPRRRRARPRAPVARPGTRFRGSRAARRRSLRRSAADRATSRDPGRRRRRPGAGGSAPGQEGRASRPRRKTPTPGRAPRGAGRRAPSSSFRSPTPPRGRAWNRRRDRSRRREARSPGRPATRTSCGGRGPKGAERPDSRSWDSRLGRPVEEETRGFGARAGRHEDRPRRGAPSERFAAARLERAARRPPAGLGDRASRAAERRAESGGADPGRAPRRAARVGVPGAREELAHRRAFDDLARVHDENAVRGLRHDAEVVGDEENGERELVAGAREGGRAPAPGP